MTDLNGVPYYRTYNDDHPINKYKYKMKSEDTDYIANVFWILVIFVVMILIIVYTYGPLAGTKSQYTGDCLLELATTYHANKCLDY
jgi:hypothetical protein